ncbi:hypothetical protein [Acidovorax sp. Root70]|uniref:hypothetical protein n=1 Tax=Acidovorax sp. Root70 TaxID=1736590 RepID=UPI001F19CDD2|nr:hypothetical protein [Acidovorax sp. Root70]
MSAPSAAAAHRKAEHGRIAHEREALTARRQQEEAVCYQRFAVEDCLRGVRAKVREAQDRLRAQEIELNDAERREKAALRLRVIEEKQATVLPAGKRADAQVRKPAADPDAAKVQRDQDAHQRAQQQNSRAQTQANEQAARATATADRAAQSRAKHAQALQAAEERRARVEKSQADALAQGRKPSAPLPVPAASAPLH